MTDEQIAGIIENILVQHFNIPANNPLFWTTPLDKLTEKFKILGYLVLLEQLLQEAFNKNIAIVENISTIYHTPQDILLLITNEL